MLMIEDGKISLAGGSGLGEPERRLLALLGRKSLVRFGAQELTFIERPECEKLTHSGLS